MTHLKGKNTLPYDSIATGSAQVWGLRMWKGHDGVGHQTFHGKCATVIKTRTNKIRMWNVCGLNDPEKLTIIENKELYGGSNPL